MAAGFSRLLMRRARRVSMKLLREAGRYAEWFLRAGTTTIEAKSGYGLSLEDELKILRAIKRVGKRDVFALRADISRRAQHSAGISITT